MKEFRVAKCLVNGKINEYAIFADGSRKKMIKINDKYGKYFEVDNELNTDLKSCLRFSDSGRIKDAVEMIRNGNGDCISSMKIIGKVDKVLYFLDRKVGEELRHKSLEGWKNTKFGWGLNVDIKILSLDIQCLIKETNEFLYLIKIEVLWCLIQKNLLMNMQNT